MLGNGFLHKNNIRPPDARNLDTARADDYFVAVIGTANPDQTFASSGKEQFLQKVV
jgi:hypothetical protein